MRDPKRIKPNWAKIAALHKKFPDWRMSQFIVNVLREMNYDPFFLEDDEFIKEIEKIIEKWTNS